MRTSFFIVAWVLIALVLPTERAAGQDNTNKPFIFFSAFPDESTEAKPSNPTTQLNLRSNHVQPYYVYVHNPTKQKQTILVELVSKRKTGQLAVAAKKSVEVEKGKTVRVILGAEKSILPPPAPLPPSADGKVVVPPAPGIPLYENPFFRATFDDGGKDASTNAATVKHVVGDTYTQFEKSFDKNVLTVKVKMKAKSAVMGGQIPVKLIPRNSKGEPIPLSKLEVEGNSLEGVLRVNPDEDGADAVELILDTTKLGEGFAEVSVDGSPRTKWYTLKGELTDPAAPYDVVAPPAAVPGKPIAIRFIADGAPTPKEGTDFGIVFNRTGKPGGEQIKYVPSRRNEGIDVRIGANGEVVFVTRSEDWVVEFPTQGVYGKRDFFARTGSTDSKPPRTVSFDATGPTSTFEVIPTILPSDPKATILKIYRPGQSIKVTATGADAESDIDTTKDVLIYLGEKPGPDGKVPPNGLVKVGKRVGEGFKYEAVFDLPATLASSELKYGAIFVNGAGIVGGSEEVIKIDYTPPEITILRFNTARDPLVSFDSPKEPLASFKPGETVRLYASAFDEESKIDLSRPVQFFIGDPPGLDGKPIQTTLVWKDAGGVIPGLKTSEGHPFWATDITLPKDIKKETELKVGVWFVNGAGLAGSRVATIKLDKDFTTATIKVKVAQGGNDRLQPGVKVWLLDQFGKVAAESKTDECGVATFVKVLPGTYLVWSVKDADQNSQDFKTVVARGGDELDVSLSIKRQLAPPIQPAQMPPPR